MQRIDDTNLSRLLYSNGGSGWESKLDQHLFNASGHAANKPGASITFQFNGTYIEVHGAIFPHPGSIANINKLMFELDSDNAVSFYTPTFDTGNTTAGPEYDQMFFKSNTLDGSPHTLIITYLNTEVSPVLWLDFITYTSTFPGGNSASQSLTSGPPTPTVSDPHTGPQHLSTRAIAGISVAAGVAGLFLLGLIFMLRRCWKVKNEAQRHIIGRAQRITTFTASTADYGQNTSKSSPVSPLSPLSSRKIGSPQHFSPPSSSLDQNPPPYHA